MKRIYIILLSTLVYVTINAQKANIDVSILPKAVYTIRYSSVDRWGEMIGNIIDVDYRLDEEGKISFANALIETTFEKEKATYILFPQGGSETDIVIYQLSNYTSKLFDIGNTKLKSKIFIWAAADKDRAIRIDDLQPGYYYVSYQSCNYGGGYILHIIQNIEP